MHFQTGRSVRSDSTGAYHLDSLPAGVVRLIVRAKGYPAYSLAVALEAGEIMERTVELDTAAGQPLPMVRIATKNDRAIGHRFDDFERRRASGRGHFITKAEIEAANYSTLNDALRMVHGVDMDCSGTTCVPRMVRSTPGCVPNYWVDGREDQDFGPSTPIRDIQGIEVYLGASDTPGEFAGVDAGCGTIVIWTRAAPR